MMRGTFVVLASAAVLSLPALSHAGHEDDHGYDNRERDSHDDGYERDKHDRSEDDRDYHDRYDDDDRYHDDYGYSDDSRCVGGKPAVPDGVRPRLHLSGLEPPATRQGWFGTTGCGSAVDSEVS